MGGDWMNKLMRRIEDDMEKFGIKKIDVAKRFGVSPAYVTSWFKCKKTINFTQFVSLLNIVYNAVSEQMLIQYWGAVNKSSIREAMEWAYANGYLSLSESLIKRKQTKYIQDPITEVYSLLNKRTKKEISGAKLYEEAEKKKIEFLNRSDKNWKDKVTGYDLLEVTLLLEICKLYALVDAQSYNFLAEYTKRVINQIGSINNDYLKKSYSLRAKVVLAYVYLKGNQVEECRVIAEEILTSSNKESFPLYYNSSLIFLAEIYAFDDYQKSMKYINKAFKMFEHNFSGYEQRKQVVQSTYDFIKIVNNEYEGLFLLSPAEKAHYLACQNDPEQRKEALEILEKLEKDNHKLTPFQKCYRALANRDYHAMKEVIEDFYRVGDFYYVKLPQKYLKRLA